MKGRGLLAHGALLLGCAVFAFPFVWLVSTSFKYDEEIFVYPPEWVPGLPTAATVSPYVSAEALERLERPAEVGAARWPKLWGQLENALWQSSRPFVDVARAAAVDADVLRRCLTQGLFIAAVRGVPPSIWHRTDQTVVDAVVGRVDSLLVQSTWNAVYREVALRDVTIRNIYYDTEVLGQGRFLKRWHPTTSGVELAPRQGGELALAYTFTDGDYIEIEGEFPLPVAADEFLGLTLPVRQDRSWHRLRLELEFDGVRYAPTDALYLGQYRWQEIGFKLAARDERDERDLGIWPLAPTADQEGVLSRPDVFRLKLGLERAALPTAIWRKYTSSYRNAYIATEHRWRYVFNSVYLAVLTIAGQVLSCSLVAYAFARLQWPGREALFGVLLATMMLPSQVTMIPVFLVFKHLGWYNTLKALWVPSFLGSAFFIFMLRQFMKSIPIDLEDAAKIDGCGFFGIYWRIILPLMKPALAAVCIFTFMNTWNDFMGPLIYISDQRLYPLALGLFDFRTEHGSEFGMLMAASTLMTLPVIAIFFMAQKYFIQGITLTGMKA